MNSNIDQTYQAIKSIVGEGSVHLHEPIFNNEDLELVQDCIKSGWVSSVGQYVDQFEHDLAKVCNVKHCVAVVNGTAALQVALMLAGVKAGDEVMMPTLTFVATANSVSHCNATPHLIDSELETLGMDPISLQQRLDKIAFINDVGNVINKETGQQISAIVPMHTFGHPVKMNEILEIADLWNLPVVSDATESLGSYYRGQPVQSFGLFSVLSFNGNKIITTGGGGAILTNSTELAQKAKHITSTAKIPHQWNFEHDQIAFNYRLPNLNAALGCSQLRSLQKFLASKRRLAHSYKKIFSDIEQVSFITEPENTKSNYWLNSLLMSDVEARNQLLKLTNENGIFTRPPWKLMHHLKMYENAPKGPTPIAEKIENCLINIPSSASLGISR